MENKTQNQPNNDSHFDVFISYRHLGKGDDDHRHSTSLARSVALELEKKGYSVFYDCWSIPEKCREALKISDYFIILVTKYSFNTNEKGGESFKEELQRIKEITDKTESKKDNVFLLEVDNAYKNENSTLTAALQAFTGTGLKGTIKQLLTDQNFSDQIDLLTKKPEHEGEKRIGKPSKLSKEKEKEKNYKRCRLAFYLMLFALIIIVPVFWGIFNKQTSTIKEQTSTINKQNDSINELNSIIKQYENKAFIAFTGGRTVQQYLASKYNVDVDDYDEPNAQYLHLPSITAMQFLWDDVNEGDPRKHCPIVLSATEIDTNNVNTNELKRKGRRIAAYLVDNIPLKVQVFNQHGSKKEVKTITPERLRKLLKEKNTTIWTTTKESGTYLEYKKLLDIKGVFDLDAIVNKQKGGRRDYDLVKHIEFDKDKNTQHIFLANDFYYYQSDTPYDSCSIVMDNSVTATIPLYVYTIAIENPNKQTVELLPRAKKFLAKIGCDTVKPIAIPDNIIATWPKK